MRRWPLVVLCLMAGTASAGAVELVSRAATVDEPAAGTTSSVSFSTDARYIAFASRAPNLVSGVMDLNGGSDVFLFDRLSGATILVSASSTTPGNAANGVSTLPVISADGRVVVYQSTATDLVPGQVDVNGKTDVFLFDRISGNTTLVSHAAGSAIGTGFGVSENAVLSGDGRYVAFQSTATNLVAGQSGPPVASSIFLFDRSSGNTLIVSHAVGSATQTGSSDSRYPFVAADGSTIAFFSFAENLVPGQVSPNFGGSVFAWDLSSGVTTLVSHVAGSPATPGNFGSFLASLSADGRFVTFISAASNLVAGQVSTYPLENVFLHDRVTDSTVLVSRQAGSTTIAGSGSSGNCRISADGRYVAFTSTAPDLVAGFVDGNGVNGDLYLYDRVADSVSLVDGHNASPTSGANGLCYLRDLSADGRLVAFESQSTDIVAGQTGVSQFNVFVFDRLLGTSRLVNHAAGSPLAGANASSGGYGISPDGSRVAFFSFATDIISGLVDNNGSSEAFLFDTATGVNSLLTRRAPDLPNVSANDYSTAAAGYARTMSDDGRFIAYLSNATNLVPGQIDTNGATDVFLFDRRNRSAALVSHAAASPAAAGNGVSTGATMSADGRWVAFSSRAGDLVSGVTDVAGHVAVFLYDRLSAMNVLVSRSAGTSVPANGDSFAPLISGDGRFLVFTSSATDLVAGQADINASPDVFLYDRVADVTTLVSHVGGSATTAGNGASMNAGISRDGAFVAFTSGATNLAAGKPGAFLSETATALVAFAGPADPSVLLSLSEDGNWIAYVSSAVNVVPGQVQGYPGTNVFLFGRAGGGTTLVSHKSGSSATTANRPSGSPSLSADGRFTAFASDATDLVSGFADTNLSQDVFLFDRADGTVQYVSATSGAATASNGISGGAIVSADGSRVAFISNGTNLVTGQDPGSTSFNVYLFSRSVTSSILASGVLSSPIRGGNDDAYPPALDAAGDVVAFQSYASNLVLGDYNGASDIFAFSLRYEGAAATFQTLPPCRVADTRGASGPWGSPALAGNASRTFALALRCGIPSDAVAVSANVTVVGPASSGTLTFYPAGFSGGGTSTVSYRAGQTRANNAILGLGGAGATVVDVSGPGSVDLVIDVNGYFK